MAASFGQAPGTLGGTWHSSAWHEVDLLISMPAKKAKRVKQDWSWAVEHYDWIRKPFGDAYRIPTALANAPKWAHVHKFFRCFGEGCEGRVQCLLAGLSSHEDHWTAIWGTAASGLAGMDASAMVCKYCSHANGERADRDGAVNNY